MKNPLSESSYEYHPKDDRNLAHPKELHDQLRFLNTSPKKRLSQNFLVDANIVRKIVRQANLGPMDAVLEIGPGPGALTYELLKSSVNSVVVVETDHTFAGELKKYASPKLSVFEEDFLTFDIAQELGSRAPLKVIANLPYHITTPILERLCIHHQLFSSALLMVQKEVAMRITAKPHTKEMSALTIFLKTYLDAKIAFPVSRTCFFPVPNVDSCVVEFTFHTPRVSGLEKFHGFVRKAFQQRRKMLRASCNIHDPGFATSRPEDLSFQEWVTLFESQQKN